MSDNKIFYVRSIFITRTYSAAFFSEYQKHKNWCILQLNYLLRFAASQINQDKEIISDARQSYEFACQ